MRKRVLLATYYFPPAGGPGVQRSLKFCKYLPAFGWEPSVMTVREEDAFYPSVDRSLFADVSDSVNVIRTKSWDPYRIYSRLVGEDASARAGVGFIQEGEPDWKERLSRWLRGNLFLPDARVGWVPFAARAAQARWTEKSFDVILTTGPPHSTHLAGYYLAKRFSVPWVADFRDPWTDISYYDELPMTWPARMLDKALERKVLRTATRILAVSPSLEGLLAGKTVRPIANIPNGYDAEDFEQTSVEKNAGFTITHVGHLAASQNPTALWRALAILKDQRKISDLRIKLVGHVDASITSAVKDMGLSTMVDLVPYVPHRQAIDYMANADLLLLSVPRVELPELIVTGKIYEYMASGTPVLGVGPQHSDAAKLLSGASVGRMFDWDDIGGMEEFVNELYTSWQSGRSAFDRDEQFIAQYSRRNITMNLAHLLDEVLDE